MTDKPILDYFIVDGKVIKRGDAGFDELEAKYVKEFVPAKVETKKVKEEEKEVKKQYESKDGKEYCK